MSDPNNRNEPSGVDAAELVADVAGEGVVDMVIDVAVAGMEVSADLVEAALEGIGVLDIGV